MPGSGPGWARRGFYDPPFDGRPPQSPRARSGAGYRNRPRAPEPVPSMPGRAGPAAPAGGPAQGAPAPPARPRPLAGNVRPGKSGAAPAADPAVNSEQSCNRGLTRRGDLGRTDEPAAGRYQGGGGAV